MILKKEWLGFILCWLLLLVLTTISHFHFRNQFHSRILDSQNEILASELNRIAEQIEFDLLERDITLLELGLTDLSSNQNEFLVKVIIQALSIPKVQEIFAYDTFWETHCFRYWNREAIRSQIFFSWKINQTPILGCIKRGVAVHIFENRLFRGVFHF